MRWLFLFVLLLNIAYVSWELNRPEDVLEKPVVNRNAPKIVLLSEIGQESVAAISPDRSGVVPGQGENTGLSKGGGCFTVGPFRDLERLRAVTRGIKKYVIDASYRSHEEKEPAMFWVYLKPVESYNKAKALSDQLKNMKVKDYFIINSGEQNNGISLGHFREKNRAYEHAKYISSLGFHPEVKALFKDYTIYWLDYEVTPGMSIPGSVLDKHLTSKNNRLVRNCS
ncbi:MAG: hypothetical protein OEY66_01660 [Gammaproteobacteria bacterium]|nr:hypothetical protein [Gammaproteobacteria bacterium]